MKAARQDSTDTHIFSLITLVRKLPQIHRHYKTRLSLFQANVNYSRLQMAAVLAAIIGLITLVFLQPQVLLLRYVYAVLSAVSLLWGLLGFICTRLSREHRRFFDALLFHSATVFYVVWAVMHLHFSGGGLLGFATYSAVMIAVPAIFSLSPFYALFLCVVSVLLVFSPVHVVSHPPIAFTQQENVLIFNTLLFAWFVAFLHYLTTVEVFLLRDTLFEKERKAELALAGGNLGYWTWDIENETIEVDERWYSMLGYSQQNPSFSFAEFFAMVHPSDRKQLAEAIQSHVQGSSDKYRHYFRMLTAAGSWKWVYAEGQITLRSAEDEPLFMHGIHQDIQTSRTQEQRLRESEARFKAYTENAPVGIFIVKDYRFTYVNPGAVRITGYSEDELHDMRITELTHPDEYRQVMHGVFNILRKGIIENEYVLRVLTKEKEVRWVEIRVSRLNLQDSNYLLSVVDITARKNAEIRLKEYATFDELTGIYNRRVGLTMLEHELHTARREQQPLSVCFVDVNGLKKVNDTFGHDEGDKLIQIVAETMRQQLRRGDLLCRLGGDEFLMVYRNCSCQNGLKIWERIEAELMQLNQFSERPYEISVSRGILEYDESVHSDVHEFLNHADKIIYIHKDQYRARMRETLSGTGSDPRLVSDGQ